MIGSAIIGRTRAGTENVCILELIGELEGVLILLFQYAMVTLVLAPLLLFFVGAIRKVRRVSNRIVRLQLEGAMMMVVGVFLKGAMFDPVVGYDPAHETRLAYWFDRGETGLFVIGLILLFFGFFLERRPRPGLRPWSTGERNTAVTGILAGAVLTAAMLWVKGASPSGWPWPPVRVGLTAGLLPMACAYCRHAFINPVESTTAEYDILGIEE